MLLCTFSVLSVLSFYNLISSVNGIYTFYFYIEIIVVTGQGLGSGNIVVLNAFVNDHTHQSGLLRSPML